MTHTYFVIYDGEALLPGTINFQRHRFIANFMFGRALPWDTLRKQGFRVVPMDCTPRQSKRIKRSIGA